MRYSWDIKSMRPKIILHVGCEKTGSTSIQNALAASYQDLIKFGILFPQSIGAPTHVQLTACVLDEYPRDPIRKLLGLKKQKEYLAFVDKVKSRLRHEIALVKPQRMIISDEHINVHLANPELLRRYRSLCEEFGDIEAVVIYLRRQDELRLSMFSQAVKNGALKNFDLVNPLMTFKHIPYRFEYLKILDNLSEAFGRETLVPRIYNRDTFVNGDVVSDFLSTVGIRDLSAKAVSRSQENRSIDASILLRLGAISRFLQRFDSRWSAGLRNRLVRSCERTFTGPGAVLSDDAHERFMSQFDQMNYALKKRYFSGMDETQSLFPQRTSRHHADAGLYPGCTLSWTEFLLKLLKGVISRA